MTNWISISADDLSHYLAAEQLDALRTLALDPAQDDPVPALIADIAELVRAQVRAAPANRLSQTASTIPPELRSTACALVIEAAQTRLPSLQLTGDQVRTANAARRILEHVASGALPVTAPTDPVTIPDAGPATTSHIDLVASRPAPLTSRSLRGL